MQTTATNTARTIETLRSISARSAYADEWARTRQDTPGRADDDTATIQAWARRTAHANGFGDA